MPSLQPPQIIFLVVKDCLETLRACCSDGIKLEKDNKLDVGNIIVENIMQEQCHKGILYHARHEEYIIYFTNSSAINTILYAFVLLIFY
mmetsp:Transcript_57829/g.117607  ORF Transcript_57829/g.117607 Transcript_57829/m.117607 type:complete len:89 (+) Transcript_57829:2435-2701(+)